jgi:hypothetical protein
MGPPHTFSLGLRFALAATVVATVVASTASVIGGGGCGPDQTEVWFCLNAETGKLQDGTYDPNHYVNGVFDPCHCYDPCGPLKSCPDVVDSGPLPPGCDAGGGSDGGP